MNRPLTRIYSDTIEGLQSRELNPILPEGEKRNNLEALKRSFESFGHYTDKIKSTKFLSDDFNNLYITSLLYSAREAGIEDESKLDELRKKLEDQIKAAELEAKAPRIEELSIKPDNYTRPNDPISNMLTELTNEGIGIADSISTAKNVKSYVMLTWLQDEADEEEPDPANSNKPLAKNKAMYISKRVSFFDRCVLNAVCTLYAAGNKTFTPQMVYRAMIGARESEFVTENQVKMVVESIDKFRMLFVKADMTEAAKRMHATLNGEKVDDFKMSDTVLSARYVSVTAGGKKTEAYELESEPILLTYAVATREIITVDANVLNIKQVGSDGNLKGTIYTTESRQPIKEYLIHRVAVMKRDSEKKKPSKSRKILFSSLYENSGVDSNNKTETARARKYALQVLDYWKAIEYISGYTVNKESNSPVSVTISV